MTIERARQLRTNATAPERAMWRLLKPFRDQGFHFRRQVQIGAYYADFACHRAKLIIEVDGDSHAMGTGPSHDARRDRYLRSRGYEVLRFSNSDVMGNPEGVYLTVEQALS
jgi:very-short-patch-repair endonuclease